MKRAAWIAGVLAASIAANGIADAATLRNEPPVLSRPAGEPIMAVVSLRDQQISVYDDKGLIMRAPVSSGQKGRETPSGIFTVIQKNAEHYSNLYDDAYMPHMQRLTWSGIALHGGALPGYAASHGCVRLPFDFAAALFSATKMGVRVVVAPGSAAPVAIDRPLPFKPKAGGAAAAASAAAATANAAAGRFEQARVVAATAYREWIAAMVPVRKTETLKLRADWELAGAERTIAAATSPEAKQQAEDAKAKADARVAELVAQLSQLNTELQPKLNAMTAARDAAAMAENVSAREAATAAARARDLEPASIFISRKTQRLYVRQAFAPVLEVPVQIQDADRPLGTHILTATERTATDIRWNAVTLTGGTADARGASAALDRISIPQDALDFIGERIWPRSSVIISDEALSAETAKDTDFIVVLSNEPQGGIKNRSPAPRTGTASRSASGAIWSRF